MRLIVEAGKMNSMDLAEHLAFISGQLRKGYLSGDDWRIESSMEVGDCA